MRLRSIPRTFGVYLAITAMQHVVIATLAGLLLFTVIDAIELSNRTSAVVSAGQMLTLTATALPTAFRLILPLSAPIGIVTAIGGLTRRGEIPAIMAAGAGPLAILIPVALIAVPAVMGYAVVLDRIVPEASAHSAGLRQILGIQSSAERGESGDRHWYRGRQWVYRVGAIGRPDGSELHEVLGLRFEAGRLKFRWDAERLDYANGTWTALGLRGQRFEADRIIAETPTTQQLALVDAPEDFVTEIAPARNLSYAALGEVSRRRARIGQPTRVYETERLNRIVGPWIILLSMVVAAALALRLGRRQSLAEGLAVGAGIGLAGWLAEKILSLLATGADLDPAWAVYGMGAGWLATAVLLTALVGARGLTDSGHGGSRG